MTTTTINWTAGNGQAVAVTVRVGEILTDAGEIKTGTAMVYVSATLDGRHEGSTLQHTAHPVAVAKIGRIGITAANMARIEAALAVARQDADLVAYEARVAAGNARIDDYERNAAKVAAMMAE